MLKRLSRRAVIYHTQSILAFRFWILDSDRISAEIQKSLRDAQL
jgi:hypothetical protein